MIIVYPDYYFIPFDEQNRLEEDLDSEVKFRAYMEEDTNKNLFYEIDEEYISQMVKND